MNIRLFGISFLWCTLLVSMQPELDKVLRHYDGLVFGKPEGCVTNDAWGEETACLRTLQQAGTAVVQYAGNNNPDDDGCIHFNRHNFKTLCTAYPETLKLDTIFHTMPYNGYGIRSIDVSEGELQEIPLGRITDACPNLEVFNARNNKIKYVSFYFDPIISPQSKLTTLDLSNNALDWCDIGLVRLVHPHMQSINFANNPLQKLDWSDEEPGEVPALDNLLINCSNTQLNAVSKAFLVSQYTERLQRPIKKEVICDMWSSAFCAVAGASLLGRTGLTFMVGATVSVLQFGYSHYRHLPALREKAEIAKRNVVFEGDEI